MKPEIQPHPSFSVEIDVSHCLQFAEVPPGTEGSAAEPVTTQSATGRSFQRQIVQGETTTTINFTAGAIDQIIKDRAVANANGAQISVLSFNKLVAQHIEDSAMRDHALREHWLRIRCLGLPKLEAYLNAYFELESMP